MVMRSPRRLRSLHETRTSERQSDEKKDENRSSSETQVKEKKPSTDDDKVISREMTKTTEKKQKKKLERQPLTISSLRRHNDKEKRPEKNAGGKKSVGFNLRAGNTNRVQSRSFSSKETVHVSGLNRARSPKWKEKSVYARNYGFKPSLEVKKPTTNYLEMLKLSSQGIFDMENMRGKSSSVWVEKWITQIRNSDDLSEENVLESLKLIQGPKLFINQNILSPKERTETSSVNLPKIMVNDCSVPLIENEAVEPKVERRKSKDYGSVACLLFALECDELCRAFPKFTLLEIADCLSESIDIDQVEFIQRRRKRWEIVVRGDEVKNQLRDNGLVIRGRWYALVEDPFFKEYYTKEMIASDLHGESVEIWRQPKIRQPYLVD